jgi:SAM-dependent methyltransferase
MQNKKLRNDLRETYDRHAQERDSGATWGWKIAERAKFLSRLLQENKKKLLEIGAGTGRDSKFFQDQGLEVVCIDLSPVMIGLCRQKGLEAYIMDMAAIDFPEASFEAIYSMNSMLHLTKQEFPGVLDRMDKLLSAGGVAYIGMYGGFDHEGIWELDYYTPKRFFSFFTDEHLEREVSRVFRILSFNRIDHDPGSEIHFQSLFLKKKPSH